MFNFFRCFAAKLTSVRDMCADETIGEFGEVISKLPPKPNVATYIATVPAEVPVEVPIEMPEPVAAIPVDEVVEPMVAQIEAEQIAHHAADPEPLTQAVIGQASQPILIGSETETEVEKKKGWWRR